MIVIGPGNHYCSIVPNFLVSGIPEGIKKSKAIVVCNCNLVNKPWHTEKFSLDDYVSQINKLIGAERIDYVTFNIQQPGEKLIKKYEDKRELLVDFQEKKKSKRKYRVIQADLLSDKKPKFSSSDVLAGHRSFIRHDSDKLAKVLMLIMEMGDYENIIKKII